MGEKVEISSKPCLSLYNAYTFAPSDSVTRGQIVTILHRHIGSPEADGVNPFYDVSNSDYYYEGVKWAYNNGVTTGYASTQFAPQDDLTREQLATLLYRYAGDSTSGNLSQFSDQAQISDYARKALSWANRKGLITGTAQGTIDPQGTAPVDN